MERDGVRRDRAVFGRGAAGRADGLGDPLKRADSRDRLFEEEIRPRRFGDGARRAFGTCRDDQAGPFRGRGKGGDKLGPRAVGKADVDHDRMRTVEPEMPARLGQRSRTAKAKPDVAARKTNGVGGIDAVLDQKKRRHSGRRQSGIRPGKGKFPHWHDIPFSPFGGLMR